MLGVVLKLLPAVPEAAVVSIGDERRRVEAIILVDGVVRRRKHAWITEWGGKVRGNEDAVRCGWVWVRLVIHFGPEKKAGHGRV